MVMEQEIMQTENERGYIKGELIRTIYYNGDEAFAIALIHILETNESITEKEFVIKGHFGQLDQGEHYIFYGAIQKHPKFGKQYQVDHFTKEVPKTKEGLILYLSSDLFYGIGKKTAEKIVNTLGESAIDSILSDQEVLRKVPGLSKEKAHSLYESLKENQGFEHIVISLSDYGFGLQMAQKIYETYKDEALSILEENPYQFMFDIEGFGFIRADEVAQQNNIPADHPMRIQAGCLYILNQSSQEGHVYLSIETCIERALTLLQNPGISITPQDIADQIIDLGNNREVFIEEKRMYLKTLFHAEEGLCVQLDRILEHPVEQEVTQAELLKIVGKIEEQEGLSYGQEQFEGIEQALASKLMILTGGPGTGKTTVIQGIITAYAEINSLSLDPKDYKDDTPFPFVLAAPTGRAAKRMNESTNLPAVTIHRLLGWNGNNSFERDQTNRLSGKLLIVDEFSMVDVWLANQLFRAIPDDMQVILVGDEDQLPSVGPGQVLTDLMASQLFPVRTLTEVYRQKEGSRIIQLAHEMKKGDITPQSLLRDHDFTFIPCQEHQAIDLIHQVYEKAISKGKNPKDIQILAPMYRTNVGINRLNKEIQKLVNPKSRQKREIPFKDVIYRTGDKVIQLVNQPESGVYNGDIGEICAIQRADEAEEQVETVIVTFDGKEVAYPRKDLNMLMHAYCTSIHKSQGSEFSIIILPVFPSYTRMLKRNLLYTAVTRSKHSLIICGDKQSFINGVKKKGTNERLTTLQERLNNIINKGQPEQIENEEELTPYDFM